MPKETNTDLHCRSSLAYAKVVIRRRLEYRRELLYEDRKVAEEREKMK